MAEDNKLAIGERAMLVAVLPGLLDGLPAENQGAIQAMVRRSVTLVGYDERGMSELDVPDPFMIHTHAHSQTHPIWVPPSSSRVT
jgi:hypothetical protein